MPSLRTSERRRARRWASTIGSGISSARLVDRVAEHHALVAGSDAIELVALAVLPLERRVHALGDVARLLVERDHDPAGVGVEAELAARVADQADPLAHEAGDVEVRVGGDLAGDDDEAGRDERLAGHAAERIFAQDGVEHDVGDLVRDLVGVTLGHGLGRELELARGTGHARPLVSGVIGVARRACAGGGERTRPEACLDAPRV